MATAITLPTSPRGYSLRPNEVEVPLEEYLRTMYHPDMDYVDGHLEERNVGDWDHSAMQGALLTYLRNRAREWGIHAVPECRLQVKPNRFRIPDIMVIPRDAKPNKLVRTAPLLCIEVLSPDDTFKRIMYRVDDYVAMGVRHVWVLDPEDGRIFVHRNGDSRWIEDRVLTVEGTPIRVDLDEIAAELSD